MTDYSKMFDSQPPKKKEYKDMFADTNPNPVPKVPPTAKQFKRMFDDTDPAAPQKALPFGAMFAGMDKGQKPAQTSKIPSVALVDAWLKQNGRSTNASRVAGVVGSFEQLTPMFFRDVGTHIHVKAEELSKYVDQLMEDITRRSRSYQTDVAAVRNVMLCVLNYLNPASVSMLVSFVNRISGKTPPRPDPQQFISDTRMTITMLEKCIKDNRLDPFFASGLQGALERAQALSIELRELIDALGYVKSGMESALHPDEALIDLCNRRIQALSMQVHLCETNRMQTTKLDKQMAEYQDKTVELRQVTMPSIKQLLNSLLLSITNTGHDAELEKQLHQAYKNFQAK